MLSLSYQDPFEDYKRREEKKRARKAETQVTRTKEAEEKAKDDINWFGVKVGTDPATSTVGGGVGKYLNINAKRPMEPVSVSALGPLEDGKKKRRIGFGNFEGW